MFIFRVDFEPQQDVTRIKLALFNRAMVNYPKNIFDGTVVWTIHRFSPEPLTLVVQDEVS